MTKKKQILPIEKNIKRETKIPFSSINSAFAINSVTISLFVQITVRQAGCSTRQGKARKKTYSDEYDRSAADCLLQLCSQILQISRFFVEELTKVIKKTQNLPGTFVGIFQSFPMSQRMFHQRVSVYSENTCPVTVRFSNQRLWISKGSIVSQETNMKLH